LHIKLNGELETIQFKYAQMSRDMMDTIVKMNLSIKARQTCENSLQEISDLNKQKVEELQT
jgi:hypothetical protein